MSESVIPPLARAIAGHLGRVEGVVAIVLGGSWARGTAAPDSDLDLGIYYAPEAPPAIAEMRELGCALADDSRAAVVTERGEWGPWVNGGAWLRIKGQEVDWLYRDLARVSEVIDDCLAGRVRCDYYLWHPHGFHNHVYAAEVALCVPLFDPHEVVLRMKERVRVYPSALNRALVEKYLFDAGFMLELSRSPAARGDVFHVAGCLFRVVAALVQVLFALNGAWFMNEKGAVSAVASMDRRPEAFAARVQAVLAAPGADPTSLHRSVQAMAALIDETAALTRDRELA